MKRICFYAVATHLGGAERSVLELLAGLKAHPEWGYEPYLILPKSSGPFVAEIEKGGYEYSVLEIPQSVLKLSRAASLKTFLNALLAAPEMIIYGKQFLRILRNERIALIHTNAIKCHLLAAVFGQLATVPVLWHLRDILAEGPTVRLMRLIEKIGRVNLIANSAATARAYRKHAKIPVALNGLNSADYIPKPQRKLSQEFRIDPKIPVIGILGVLARWKGQVEFIEMAKLLSERGIDAHFVIVGDAIYDTEGERGFKQTLLEKVREVGLEKRIHFTGFRQDAVDVINSLDILVHASIRPEPFGRVVAEALACEVPVMASREGGVLEQVSDGISALLFTPGNSSEMALVAQRLLGDEPLRARLKKNGRARFLSTLTHEKYVESVKRVYDELFLTTQRSR